MRLDNYWLLRLTLLLATLTLSSARRVRVQPVEYEDDAYYTDAQDDGSSRAVVLVGEDGYYQPQAQSRGQDNYIPATRGGATRGSSFKDTRTQVKDKAPPVQTIRNYNKVNDDGSFTFGYEAADGSFKEETRGTDCVVRGKYGYVDPDGNKREFTYVSGNPCDPNAAKEEDESRERPGAAEDSVEENVPANYPTRPIRPLRPLVTTPQPEVLQRVVTQRPVLYQQYEQEEEEEPEPEQVLRAQPQPVRHRVLPVRPTYVPEERPVIQSRPRYTSTTPSYEESRPLTITPRPLTVTPTPARAQPPATTYRPQLLQVAVTPRPALVYSTKQVSVQPTQQVQHQSSRNQPGNAARDFVAEYQKFQLDNQISSTPASVTHRTAKPTTQSVQAEVQPNSNPVYSSELVYDPSSGQYKTALYQTLPQTEGDFTLNHQIQPYVHQPPAQLVNFRQLQQQSPLYRHQTTTPRVQANQQAYQQQQSELQFQNSQQLFAQQQRARAQQATPTHAPRTEPQQFYYIQPQALQGVSNGQIDAFLRGHNIQY